MKSARVKRAFVAPGQHSDILGISELRKRLATLILFAVQVPELTPQNGHQGLAQERPIARNERETGQSQCSWHL